ncbi:MAG: hypothetical protein JWO58_389 [Chitinophagaceae bacterium]|nr:hypothetical protein [Chitinophagaceae bacterium]
MKYLILLSLLLLTIAFTHNIYAQEYPLKEYPVQKNAESESQTDDTTRTFTPEQRAEKQSNLLQKKLGLTEEQKMKVYNISLSRINQTAALREKTNKSTDKKGAREAYQKIRTDYDQSLNGVLNDDQQKTWGQLKANAQAKRAEHRKNQPKDAQRQPAEMESDDLDIQ